MSRQPVLCPGCHQRMADARPVSTGGTRLTLPEADTIARTGAERGTVILVCPRCGRRCQARRARIVIYVDPGESEDDDAA